MIFFLEPKIEWQKKNLRFKWIGKFIDFDRIKKKKETYVVLAFPCELDANVFKWVLKKKPKMKLKTFWILVLAFA